MTNTDLATITERQHPHAERDTFKGAMLIALEGAVAAPRPLSLTGSELASKQVLEHPVKDDCPTSAA